MHKIFLTVIKIILTATIFSACSSDEDLSTPNKVYINVLFTPESFCTFGYNDMTIKAIETYSHKYGYDYSFCVPESLEDGMKYYTDWCEAKLDDNVTRSLFVFASSIYDEPLSKAPHPIAESRKDILIFELEKELPYAYTFDISYYGASYMIGSYYLKFSPVCFHVITANPYLSGLYEVMNGLTDATKDTPGGEVDLCYIDESPDGGLDDDDGAFIACMNMYLLNKNKMNIFIPYAGFSNLGVYRFSQSNNQITVGMDCVDPNSYSYTYLCMNKRLDLALDDFFQLWVNGDDIPRHTLYTLESGRITVNRKSSIDSDSEELDKLFEKAVTKEKEYYKTANR